MTFPAYPEYKDSGVEWLGEVPAHWDVVALKRLGQMQSGDFISPAEIEDAADYPVIGGNGPRGFTTSYTHEGFFPVIGRQGALCGNINYARDKFWASEHAVVVSPEDNVDAVWLGELLRSMDLNQYSVSAAQPGLAVDRVKNLSAPFPPHSEQSAISRFLDHETARIDALIEEQQRLIELLKEKRQAVISHSVTKGLDPDVPMKDSGVEWLGEVPAHWEVLRVKNAAKLESGHTPNKEHPEYWDGGSIPWVSLNDSKALNADDYISDTRFTITQLGIENSSARMLPPKAVVFTRDATIGLTAITTREMTVSQHLIAWICDEKKVLPEFLLLAFYAMSNELERFTFGATIKTIGMPDVRRLTMTLPPLEEQKRIVGRVQAHRAQIGSLIEEAEKAMKLLTERRSALISAAVTGKIDVRGWEPPESDREAPHRAASEVPA